MKSVHRAELIDELARSMGGDRQGAEVAINALFGDLSSGGGDGVIALILKRGSPVVITGFGTFTPRGHYATTIPNPNGEPISVPSWRGVTFRAGAALRRAVQPEVRLWPVHR
jgi:nucleoid DNA-binding protein